jgi:serine phosphatase RsbU (regulator of sigma subunit)/anti-sigma regulatory factor (Ser/Thr protein kinase)
MSSSLKAGGAESAQPLFAKLRGVLADYDTTDFALYSLEGNEARLIFSCGVAAPLEGSAEGRVAITSHPRIREFLSGGPSLFRLEGKVPSAAITGPASQIAAASAAIPLIYEGRPIGFVLIFGALSAKLVQAEVAGELGSLVTLFSATFAQRRAVDRAQRVFLRTEARLRELQEGLDILRLNDLEEISRTVLQRALKVLGCRSGGLWLGDAPSDEPVCAVGTVSSASQEEAMRLMQACSAKAAPALQSSITGEIQWDFDVDSIYMASIVVFPLKTRETIAGYLVALDATVSSDVMQIVESAALVGAVAIETWRNAQSRVEEERLREQLNVAAAVQQRLLPSKRVRADNLSIAHYSQYCDEAGGDYVDTILGHEPYMCHFAVGDVSGHGIGAAMLMVGVRARLRAYLDTLELWSHDEVLDRLNRSLCLECAPDEFVTFILASLDTRTGILRYASAGHEPPLLYNSRSNTWRSLPSTGLPLGIEPAASFAVESEALEPGEVLIFATDGATEARDPDDQPLGVESIRNAIEAKGRAAAESLVSALVERTLAHTRGRPFSDDVTYLVVRLENTRMRVAEAPPELGGDAAHVLRFPCTLADKDTQLDVLRRLLEARLPASEASHVLISLEEAMTNAVVHGNDEDPQHDILLRLWLDRSSVKIAIEHGGREFDPRLHLAGCFDHDRLAQESGRGLLIIASMMDEAVYWNKGKSLLLVKQCEQR